MASRPPNWSGCSIPAAKPETREYKSAGLSSALYSITQVEVPTSLLGAHQTEPRRRFWKEFHTSHHSRSWALGRATGDLRREGKENLIHQSVRHEVAEESRAAFMEHDSHAEFITQKRKDGGRVDQAAGIAKRRHLRRIQCFHADTGQVMLARLRRGDQDSGAGRVEDSPVQVQIAAPADDDEQRMPRLLESSSPVAGIEILGLGIDGFCNPKVGRVDLVNGSRCDDDCIHRGPEQSHDKAVRFVKTADCAPA